AESGKSLVEMEEDIYELAGTRFYTDRIDLKLDSQEEIKPILNDVKKLKTVGKYVVNTIDTKDGVKLMLGDTTKILVRPSGTEPLLRIYYESDNKEKLEELKDEPIIK
ncbi:phosphoglucomutase/phosphomannomutase family protein, partial [bacterium]|nr:phosphoglucomutase/phosphomannomutase family protein [bacterium]